MRPMLTALLPTVVIASSGCVPFPHVVTLSPEISGTVTAQGLPVEGMAVSLATGLAARPCEQILQTVKTQPDGMFLIQPRTDLRFLYAPLVAPISVSVFTVCVSVNGETVMGYRGMVRQNESIKVILRCNVDRHMPYVGADGFRGEAVCEVARPGAMTSNPSIERTTTGKPVVAAHVER